MRPAEAFVDGRMIRGIKEHLFAVLRDILYIHGEVYEHGSFELDETQGITNAVLPHPAQRGHAATEVRPDIVVCWGGHSISREEYDYTKQVGYELGLRGLNVCTGCGPGAMKGPMKGATIGHAKQRIRDGRYIGLTEPGIVAAEPPNAIVNQLVILPDIEKRLEAFVRTGHGIVVFPGGAGTAEEILYLLGILLIPANEEQPFPVVFTGPRGSEEYFGRSTRSSPRRSGRERARSATGSSSTTRPRSRARCSAAWTRVREFRRRKQRRLQLQLALAVDHDLQQPFEPTHEAMAALDIRRDHAAAPAGRPAAPGVLGHRHRQRQGAGHPRRSRSTGLSSCMAIPSCSSRSTRCSSRSCASAA